MAEVSWPWVDGGAVDAGGWRAFGLGLPSGIIGDRAGGALVPYATGGDKIVRMPAGRYLIQGATYEATTEVLVDLGVVGTPPAGGQYRADRIVLRHDMTQPVASRVRFVAKAGSPSSSSTPAPPSLTRSTSMTGVWEEDIAVVTRGPGDVAVTQPMISLRAAWASPVVHLPSSGVLPSDAPIGARVILHGKTYLRVAGSPPTWVSPDDPAWGPLGYSSGYEGGASGEAQARIRAGWLELCGTYARESGVWAADEWTTIRGWPTAWNGLGLTGTRFYPVACYGSGTYAMGILRITPATGLEIRPSGANTSGLTLDGIRLGPVIDSRL